MNAGFRTRILVGADELAAIETEWSELCQRCACATPFQSPEWILTWINTFLPAQIATIEVRHEGRLAGLAPFLIYPRGEDRVLAFLAGGVSDYLDLLADPASERDVTSTILGAIMNLEGWTTLDLTDVSGHSVLHRTLLAPFATVHDNCSVLSLPRCKEDFLQLLSKRQRANLRNGRARLQRAGGGEFEVATPETLPEFLDDLFRLHTTRWTHLGESGVLAEENIRNFHANASPKLLVRGVLRMYRLRVAGRTIAGMHTLRQGSAAFCYLQGFDPEFGSLGPGTQLMCFAIEDALHSGLERFDFLRGKEYYKSHWRAVSEPTYRIQLSRSAFNSVSSVQIAA